MELSEIKRRYFHSLQAGRRRSLSRQLYECIDVALAELPHEEEFPAERELAAELRVNRATLRRAIKPFVDAGLLRRNNRGTIVYKEADAAVAVADEPPHPFLHTVLPRRDAATRTMTLLVYENLPRQVAFWRDMAEGFRAESGLGLKVEWVNRDCRTDRDYFDLIERTRPDIFQIRNPLCFLEGEQARLLRPPPASALRRLAGGDYRAREYFSLEPALGERAVPLYFAPILDVVNLDLAERHGFEPRGLADGMGLTGCLADAARALPENVFVTNHIDALTLPFRYSFPPAEASVAAYLRDTLTLAAQLAPRRESALLRPLAYPFLHFEEKSGPAFEAGSLFHLGRLSHFIPAPDARRPFRVRYALPDRPAPGAFGMRSCMALGVFREARRYDEAEAFLLHLLSPEAQRRLAGTGMVPFHRAADGDFARFFGMDPAATATALAGQREMPRAHYEAFWDGRWCTNPFYRRVFEHPEALPDIIADAGRAFRRTRAAADDAPATPAQPSSAGE